MSIGDMHKLRLFQNKLIQEVPPSKDRLIFTLIVGLVGGICLAQFLNTAEITYPCVSQKSLDKDQKNEKEHNYENSTIADKLKKKVRILCWVMTNPKNHKKRAIHVKRTWGKRCNILLFMSSADDGELPTVKLDVDEGRENLWLKTKEAFKYVYKHHYNDADWFYKADDDTYAVVENLRYMLYPYSSQTPVYFGFKFKEIVKQGYMSGGAGYVLSREALRRLVEEGIPHPTMCSYAFDNEDVQLGFCLENLNVTAGDSRDAKGRGRMFPFMLEVHLGSIKHLMDNWYWSYQYYKNDDGLDCCSDLAISWHYVYPSLMYIMEYLIYNLKTYGLVKAFKPLPPKLGVGELLPAPIDEPMDSNEDSINDEDRYANATKDVRNLSSTEKLKERWKLKKLALDA